MIGLFILLALVLFMIIRIGIINFLFDDWNYQLSIYIENNENVTPQNVEYLKTAYLVKWKYYLRLNVWSIKDAINNPFLIYNIHKQIQENYKN